MSSSPATKPSLLHRLLVREAQDDADIVYPWELPSIMRKHIVTGAMGTVYFVMVSGMFLVTFGNSLGLTYRHWAVLSTGSSLAFALQLISALLVSRVGVRKHLWFITALIGRLLRGTAIALLFWLSRPMPETARILFLTLVILGNCFDALCVPPWLSWLADIIPERDHGHFMGRRNAWLALAHMSVAVLLAAAVDQAPEATKVPILMVGFAFGFAVGILDLVIHRTIPEPRMPMPPPRRFWEEVLVPLADKAFRPWLVFNAVWTFSMTLGGSLSLLHFVENLGIRRNLLGGSLVLIMLPLAGTMLTGKIVGKLVDRVGVRRMLFFGHLLWATLPAWWLLATPANALAWLGLGALLGGIGASTALIASQKLMTRMPTREYVSMYVAVSTCIGCLAGAMGPLLAGALLHALEGMSWQVGSRTMIGFHILFLASFLLRSAATLLIRRVQEPPGQSRPGSA